MFAGVALLVGLLAYDTNRPLDFDTEVLPVLTKSGCNAGACHGAAAGRGGLRLSLWGAAPAADYDAIVHAFEGRRVNLARPEQSLVLRKSTGQLPHGGDQVLDPDSPGAERLKNWIAQGAPRGTARRLTEWRITPRRITVGAPPTNFSLESFARFDQGTLEDVRRWTVFSTTDSSSVEVDDLGTVRVHRRGQHVVIARFLQQVEAIQINVRLSDDPVDLSHEPRDSYVDEHVLSLLTELRLPVSTPAADHVFARRAALTLTGRLLDPDIVDSFVADPGPDKREQLVDRLLASSAFVDAWTLRWARLLRVHSLPNEPEVVSTYGGWLRDELRRGRGMDAMARDLLTATGDSHQIGPANFARMVADARGHAELAGQFLLGVRLGCANCHNHPLDRWTQDDYHGFAAVFAKLDRGRHVQATTRGDVTNLRTSEPAIPRIPGVRDLSVTEDQRGAVADWLSTDANRSFAKAHVNRLWRVAFGRGLVEPTDDRRDTNPATHPQLLQELTNDFVGHDYDLRHLLRRLVLSRSFQRSSASASGHSPDDRFYSHAIRRPLEPEVLADAIADVTGVPDSFDKLPMGTRAVSIIDPFLPAPALDVLGRCSRASGCDENTPTTPGVAQQLHLLNGDLINRKLTDPQGRLHRTISQGRSDREIVDEFYRRALGRPPSKDELDAWSKRVAANEAVERTQRLEDFLWALLNSRDFRENH